MENQSNSRAETIQKRLALTLSGDEGLVATYKRHLPEWCELVAVEQGPQLILHLDSNQKNIRVLDEGYEYSLLLNEENFKNLLAIFQKEESPEEKLAKKKNEELFLGHWKKNLTKSNLRSEYSLLFEELMKIIADKTEMTALPAKILQLRSFHSYRNCQILLHERGKVAAESFDELGVYKQVDIKFFQKIYNQIKKSKNKQFSQISSGHEELDVFGTFLAAEFEIQAYRLILVLSRNEFLNPRPEEQMNFQFVCQFLGEFLKALIQMEHQEKRKANIEDVFNHWDEKILLEKKGKIVKENYPQLTKEDAELSSKIKTRNNFQLSFYKNKNESLIPDIHHHQRIALLGDLLNTLQHELNNPLFGIKLSAEILSDERPPGEIREVLEEMAQHAERCQSIIKNFSSLYQDEKIFLKCDLVRLIKEAIVLTKSEIREIQKVFVDEQSSCFVETNPTWFTQIIFNALLNAGQAIKLIHENPRKGIIHIRLKEDIQQKKVVVSISDNGSGISLENETKIFTPFFTTKKEGTGLGLLICQNLAKKLRGSVELKNSDLGPGAKFILELPSLI